MQAALMRNRRFWPLFWTQFLGAFNDNFFKNALVILITFRNVRVAGVPPEQMVALSAAVFIAPYFLFSGIAGQLADKLDKARLVRATKVAELGVMAIGAAGFWLGSVELLLVVLFCMGLQSTVFGPCKYSILPQHLADDELVAGNALVEMGTYLAILLGTLAGGVLVNVEGGTTVVALGVLGLAVLGIGTSRFVPPAPSADPGLALKLDPIRPTLDLVRLARANQGIWLAILGISWFWVFGSVFLSLFPSYCKEVLGGNEALATLFLALFSIGIGLGSMLCEKLSRQRLELGLVPIGSLGMSLFTLDLWFVGQPWAPPAEPLTVAQFLSTLSGIRICADLIGLSVFGGFLIVPLYTFVQARSSDTERSRIIAANNVVNAFWMVMGSLALMGLFAAGLDTIDVLLAMVLVNTAVAVYMYSVVAEFMLRFCVWVLSVLIYRVRVVGHEHVPNAGPCVLVANHVSFVDWFIIAAAVRRPPRFVMHKSFYAIPVMRWLFRQAGVIPIAGRKEDPECMERAFEQIHRDLQAGWVVCIFPEGRITDTGEMYPFRPGIERIVARDPVPVIPVALNGLWGSYFSRKDGRALSKPFRRLFSRVWVTIGEPVPGTETDASGLQDRVRALWSTQPAA